ncbi:MAG TPA: hypothetical protein VMR14_17040, partial [Streptosporangiaceae bacterium]|nr:hypothetical protein [Streptosporangiaceae bacterium]
MTVPPTAPSSGQPGDPALARDGRPTRLERLTEHGQLAQDDGLAHGDGLARDGLDWLGPEPEEPTDAELFGLCPDLLAGPPDGSDAWLADLSAPELEALAEAWAAANLAGAGPIGAGFTRDLPTETAEGFACGGPLDLLEPGRVLAGFVADACGAGLRQLPDDHLVGLLLASRRLSAWQAGIELAAIAELDARRRKTTPRSTSATYDHITAEVAAALVLASHPAEELL